MSIKRNHFSENQLTQLNLEQFYSMKAYNDMDLLKVEDVEDWLWEEKGVKFKRKKPYIDEPTDSIKKLPHDFIVMCSDWNSDFSAWVSRECGEMPKHYFKKLDDGSFVRLQYNVGGSGRWSCHLGRTNAANLPVMKSTEVMEIVDKLYI